jgi:hypothetical protein
MTFDTRSITDVPVGQTHPPPQNANKMFTRSDSKVIEVSRMQDADEPGVRLSENCTTSQSPDRLIHE